MKIQKVNIKLLALILITCSCNLSSSIAQSKADSYNLRIDPSQTISLPASTVFDEVSYIPLETTKECLFGSISQLFVTDVYYILCDNFTRSVFIFKRNGKFHAKIERDIYNDGAISVDQFKKEISFRLRGDIVFYDFNGKLLRTKHKYYVGEIYHLPGDLQVYYDYRVSKKYLKDTISHEVFFARNKTKFKEYFAYNMQKSTLESFDWVSVHHGIFYEPAYGTEILYTRPYDYSIYRIGSGELNLLASFLFPADRAMPNNYLTDTVYSDSRVSYFKKFPAKIYAISFPYLFGKNLFFKINSEQGFLNESFLYNLQKGALIPINKIVPDQLSSYLPITDFGIGDEFINKNFLTAHDGNIYTSISSASMIKIISSLDQHGNSIPDPLKKYNKNASRNDNPIIVQIKPKLAF